MINKNKKIVFIVLGILIIIVLTIVLFLVFGSKKTQNDNKERCFEIVMNNSEIEIDKSYQMKNANGYKQEPITFRVKNTCESDTRKSYQVNLEVLEKSSISFEYVKVDIYGEYKNLDNYEEVKKTDNNAKSAFKLIDGNLLHNEEDIFDLRVWIKADYNFANDNTFNFILTIIPVDRDTEIRVYDNNLFDDIRSNIIDDDQNVDHGSSNNAAVDAK